MRRPPILNGPFGEETKDGQENGRNLAQIAHAPGDGATMRPYGNCSAGLNVSYGELLGDPEPEVAGSAASRRSRV